ncbi:hypothetical protein AAGU50_11125 [Aeromonas dhakensis]|uniref:flavodoxin family protein n=1 Tax=Aeromonas dhakensis TaxID=196024 RepID=UPI003F8326B3
MSYLHWFVLVLALTMVAVLGVLFGVTWIESYQARQLATKEPYAPATSGIPSVAVVYFSRSGNTALAARHLAKRLDAHLVALEVPAYELGLMGLTHALKDANALKSQPQALPDTVPRTLDLSPYETVWLGSPVWLYSPAPPIWAFVENNRFDGQHVVLFNTYNSHFGDEHIAAFKAKVLAKGARSFEHRSVLRGRMLQQISPGDMLQVVDEQWFVDPVAP